MNPDFEEPKNRDELSRKAIGLQRCDQLKWPRALQRWIIELELMHDFAILRSFAAGLPNQAHFERLELFRQIPTHGALNGLARSKRRLVLFRSNSNLVHILP